LQDGLLTVGFGGSKGFGQVKMDGYAVQWGFLSDADALAAKPKTAVSGLYRVVAWRSTDAELRQLQQSWIDAFHSVCEKPTGPRSSKGDPYFGQLAEQLYGKATTL
jgi:hypothetical protein